MASATRKRDEMKDRLGEERDKREKATQIERSKITVDV
jgi:hypothetical protein